MRLILIFFVFVGAGFAQVSSLISETQFNKMFPMRSVGNCGLSGAQEVFTYDAFIEAATWFPEFANYGAIDDQKREIAAFFAQAAHETTGGGGAWCGGVEDPTSSCFIYGLCFTEEVDCPGGPKCGGTYTSSNVSYPPVVGKFYHGRGAMQLSWNYNYGRASEKLTNSTSYFLNNPDYVKSETWAFRTAIWFWMDAVSSRPSPHALFTSKASGDNRGGTFAGTTNIINGGVECNEVADINAQHDRVNFYKNFAEDLGVAPTPSTYTGNESDFYYCTLQDNFSERPWVGDVDAPIIVQGGGPEASLEQSLILGGVRVELDGALLRVNPKSEKEETIFELTIVNLLGEIEYQGVFQGSFHLNVQYYAPGKYYLQLKKKGLTPQNGQFHETHSFIIE